MTPKVPSAHREGRQAGGDEGRAILAAEAETPATGPRSKPARRKSRPPRLIEPPRCAHCGQPARKRTGHEIYLNRDDLAEKVIWQCAPCDATVGSDPHGKPLGRPGNKKLREARMKLHDLRFDPIWKAGIARYSGTPLKPVMIRKMCQSRLYVYLAFLLGIEPKDCHIAAFDLDTCRRAWLILGGVTYEMARAYAKAEKERKEAHDANSKASV